MKNKRLTQTDAVEIYLHAFGSITSWEAFSELGITRLSAVIYKLVHERGIDFEKEFVSSKNRLGRKTHFVRYKIKELGNVRS